MYYEVIVGNIGTVYSGNDKTEALRVFDVYQDQSENSIGSRAYGEDVTLLGDGEMVKEHYVAKSK